MAKREAGGTPAITALREAGVDFRLHPYDHDPSPASEPSGFGEEAARALGVDPRRIFKTLIADVAGELVVAVVPVAGRLDLKRLASALGAKRVTMADPAAAARSSGYVIGGISPVGQRTPLRTVVDASAADFGTIYVSAGRRGLQVELSPHDLVSVAGARWAAVTTSDGSRRAVADRPSPAEDP